MTGSLDRFWLQRDSSLGWGALISITFTWPSALRFLLLIVIILGRLLDFQCRSLEALGSISANFESILGPFGRYFQDMFHFWKHMFRLDETLLFDIQAGPKSVFFDMTVVTMFFLLLFLDFVPLAFLLWAQHGTHVSPRCFKRVLQRSFWVP